MKKEIISTIVVATLFFSSCCDNQKKTNMNKTEFTKDNTIFSIGSQGSADWFTGTVYVTPLMQPGGNLHYAIGDVKFEPSARTYWHTHPVEQVLLVTDGKG